jgi:hypothetical protein
VQAARRERAAVVGDEHVDDEIVAARIVQAREPFAFRGRKIGNAQVLERIVPVRAPFRRDALGDGVRRRHLVGGAAHDLDELALRQTGFVEQRHAQAGEVILAQVAAAQQRARFVDRARQEHEAAQPRARIARRSPAQADRAHRNDRSPDV